MRLPAASCFHMTQHTCPRRFNKMDATEYQRSVEEVERTLANRQHSREEILVVLLRVTVNAIHVNEDKELRERIEREYIKALGFLSAVEEQKQIYAMGES